MNAPCGRGLHCSGLAEGTRTPGHRVRSTVLFQLSYSGIRGGRRAIGTLVAHRRDPPNSYRDKSAAPASFPDWGKPAHGRHHSSGSHPADDGALSPPRGGVSLARHVFSCRLLSGLAPPTRTEILLAPNQVTCQLAQCEKWSLRNAELNRVSPAWETGGLLAPSAREIVTPQVRIERTTSRLTAAHSTNRVTGEEKPFAWPLSQWPGEWREGGSTGTRTLIRHLKRVLRCRYAILPLQLDFVRTPRGLCALAVRAGLAKPCRRNEWIPGRQRHFWFHDDLQYLVNEKAGSAPACGVTRIWELPPVAALRHPIWVVDRAALESVEFEWWWRM